MWYKNIAGRFFGLLIKHACDRRTHRQTNGQNYDSQDRASIAASGGKKLNRHNLATVMRIAMSGTMTQFEPHKLKTVKNFEFNK